MFPLASVPGWPGVSSGTAFMQVESDHNLEAMPPLIIAKRGLMESLDGFGEKAIWQDS